MLDVTCPPPPSKFNRVRSNGNDVKPGRRDNEKNSKIRGANPAGNGSNGRERPATDGRCRRLRRATLSRPDGPRCIGVAVGRGVFGDEDHGDDEGDDTSSSTTTRTTAGDPLNN